MNNHILSMRTYLGPVLSFHARAAQHTLTDVEQIENAVEMRKRSEPGIKSEQLTRTLNGELKQVKVLKTGLSSKEAKQQKKFLEEHYRSLGWIVI